MPLTCRHKTENMNKMIHSKYMLQSQILDDEEEKNEKEEKRSNAVLSF
jgi:hypothetical protein